MPRKLRLLVRHGGLLASCVLVLCTVRLKLTFGGYGDLRRRLTSSPQGPLPPSTSKEPTPHDRARTVAAVAWSVRQAARIVPRATCLTQAIAGQALLRQRGEASTIRIGVRRSLEGSFQAHAWLVHDDRTVLGGVSDPGPSFVPIATMVPTPE